MGPADHPPIGLCIPGPLESPMYRMPDPACGVDPPCGTTWGRGVLIGQDWFADG